MKLRLGRLPRTEFVKIKIALPLRLKEQLDRYAAVHSQAWGESVDAGSLIPHMLAQFVARDRAFRSASKRDSGLSRRSEDSQAARNPGHS
jgi:hypothetical protein